MNCQIKEHSNSELLTEIEVRLTTDLFNPQEIKTFTRLLAQNYSQISQTLTSALQQERLKQQDLLNSLTEEERNQVNKFLEEHGFKKN